MLTQEDYFAAYSGHPDITDEIRINCGELLVKVNALLEDCISLGWKPLVNPATGTLISGTKNGGWRPPESHVGAPDSSHKKGSGVDVADGDGTLDRLIDDELLEKHGLYREHPDDTLGWSHLTTRAPRSGRRTFKP